MATERREPDMGDGPAPAPKSLGRNRAALPPDPPPTVDADGVIHGLQPSPASQASVERSASPRAPEKTDLQALLVDVFDQTGIKVTADDPIVAAALIQSAVMRRAGVDAAQRMQDCVVDAVKQIADAVNTERAAAASLDRAAGDAHQQLIADAKLVGEAELSQLRERFLKAASTALEEVRSTAALSKGAVRWRIGAGVAVGLAVGAMLTLALGRFQPRPMSPEQVRLMHNGLMLDAAWPKLPPATRALIEGARPPEGADAPTKAKGK